MTITLCIFALHGSGGDRIEVELMNGLVSRGHKVNLVIPKGHYSGIFPLDKRVDIIETRDLLRRPPWPPYFELISSFFVLPPRIPDSDIIISPFSLYTGAVLIASRVLKKGVAIDFLQHYDPIYFKSSNPIVHFVRAGYRWYVGASFRFFDKKTIVLLGQWINDMLAKRHRRKGIVINPGIDANIFYPRGPQKRDREIITHIAHSGYWKGLNDTIEAIRYVDKEDKNIELVTITRNPDYKPCGDFPERVIRNAHSDQIAEQHSSASLFVSSSIYEGFGLSPLEAMACGLPCVLTRSKGIDDYAVDRYNCILVPPKNPEALARGILMVLRDKDLAKKIAKGGIETAKRFTWEKMVDKFEKVLKNVSENRKNIC